MSDGGKGSKQRPCDREKFGDNYDVIWTKDVKEEAQKKHKAELAESNKRLTLHGSLSDALDRPDKERKRKGK